MAPCPECGIDEDAMSVTDALAAIRTLPRRYREALADVDEETLRTRPDDHTWSMAEYAAHVREAFDVLAMLLPEVLDHPGMVLPEVELAAEGSLQTWPDWALDRGLVLERIGRACDALVERGEATSPEAWDRTFRIGEREHTAAWVPRHVAHEGAHHLRDIARVRERVSRPAAG